MFFQRPKRASHAQLLLSAVGLGLLVILPFAANRVWGLELLSQLASPGSSSNLGTDPSPFTIPGNLMGGGQSSNGNRGPSSADPGTVSGNLSGGGDDGGNGGNGNGGRNSANSSSTANGDCVLRISTCSATDPSCLEPPVFVRTDCADTRCTLPNNLCTRISGQGPSSSMSLASVSVNPSSSGQNQQQQGNGDNGITVFPSSLSSAVFLSGNDSHGQGSNSQGDTNSGQGNGNSLTLGCFTANGTWTTNRSACATTQGSSQQLSVTQPSGNTNPTTGSVAPSVAQQEVESDQQDQHLQSAFQTIFHVDEARTAALNGTLNAASSALERLQVLSSAPLPATTVALISATQEWITQMVSDLSSTDVTTDQITAKATELASRLQDVTDAVSAATAAQRSPKTLIGKMDTLMASIPTVFSFLQQQNIATPALAVSEYQNALTLYNGVRSQCLITSDSCLALSPVLDHLDTMRSALLLTLNQAGRSDLQDQIDAMLQ